MAEVEADARVDRTVGSVHEPEREGRQLALASVFEADFGQRTALAALDRRLSEDDVSPRSADHARRIVAAVMEYRDSIDSRIEEVAPTYPVVQLARIDRALLRCGMGELLHCPTTPDRVAISEWVELARTYSGEPTRRLMNGVLGRVSRETANVETTRGDVSSITSEDPTETMDTVQTEGPTE